MPRFRPTINPRLSGNNGAGGGGNFTAAELKPPPAKKVSRPVSDFGGVRPQTAPKGAVKTPAPVKRPAAVPKPAQLPSTSGRTTVPVRSVTPHPAPTPKAKTPAPVAPKPARKPAAAKAAAPPQLSVEDQATAAVNAALAPLYASQTKQASGQNAAITQFTKAIIAQLLPGAAQVGGQFDQAIGAQTNLSNSAADALRAANPNTQDQALLSAINAPQAQQAQLAAQNNAAFNGGAAVGQYVGGVLPIGALQSQKLGAMTIAHQQPAIEGLRGQQALGAALAGQQAERAKIDAMRPDLVQKYTAANTAAEQKQAYLDIARQSLGLKAQNQSFSQKLAVAKTNLTVEKYNAGVTAKNNKIDVTVSKSIPGGIARNSNGDPIIRGGKVITIDAAGKTQAKVPTASQISGFVDKWKSGKTQSVTSVAKDADGNPVYDANGAPKTISETKTSVPPLKYGQAYRRLRTMGLTDVKARSYLNTAYQKGEQGRGWLTNDQRSTLQKAGRQSYVGFFQGHAFIALPQAAALKKANKLPPGELVNGRYFIAPGF